MPRAREESAISTERRHILLRILIVLSLLACAGSVPTFARPQQPPDRIELAEGWQLASANKVTADGANLSRPDYADKGWHAIRRMPATVLEALQDDGTYPDLYFGKNLVDEVPQDLYKQDWWYRTTFKAPAGHSTYLLELPGINYRADVWLNGRQVAGNTQIVGMYDAHELDVARWIKPGEPNTLADQGHTGAGPSGRRRCGAGRQLVGLDQLELSRLPGSGQGPRPRQLLRL